MKPEKKQALTEFHRNQILNVAERLFQERGTHNTTIDDLAKEAGYSKATLYVYFKNKDEILNSITLKGMRQLRVYLQEAVATQGDWFEAYDALCDAVAKFYEETPITYEATAGKINVDLESPDTPKIFHEIYGEGELINQEVIRFLERGVAAGFLKQELHMLQTVFLFWASLSGLVRMAAQKETYLERRLHTSKRDFLRDCYRMLLNSILIVGRGV